MKMIAARIATDDAPPIASRRQPDMMTSEAWEAIVQIMIDSGPYAA